MNTFNLEIVIYRLFDIGHEVDLKKAQTLLNQVGQSQEFRLGKGGKAVVIENVPLILALEDSILSIDDQNFRTNITAKLWNFGALSISFRISLPPLSPQSILKLNSQFNDSEVLNRVANEKAQFIVNHLSKAIKKPKIWESYEEYIIYIDKTKIDDQSYIKSLTETEFLYQLLVAEGQLPLSEKMKEPIRANTFQYSLNDLVVVDWNSTFVRSEGDSKDICDVIEFANVQLLELRYYDYMLDKKLSSLYKEVMATKQSIFNKNFTTLNQESSQLYIEISEVVEQIENTFKVVGDMFYARVFRSALDRLKIKDWQSNVDHKLQNILYVSQLNSNEIHTKRSQWLEIIIIILIAIEVIPFVINLIPQFLEWLSGL
ncbi:MAG: hypothetical protein KDD58_02455 [Bdellovibrionales bacterium]|nr:hypothetical protein [Bdellovibrionales bacterium]